MHYNTSTEQLLPLLAEFPQTTKALQADLTSEESVTNLLAQCQVALGPVDVLIVNHGIFPPQDVHIKDMTLDQFKHTIDTNLTSSFLICKSFMLHLEKRRESEALETGNIILIGSTSGLFGERGHIDYSCSKSAMMYGMLKTLKNEIVQVVPKGRANCVAPGWVLTKMAQAAVEANPEVLNLACKTVAMRKVASPEDVAHSVLFLANDQIAGHLSGNVIECHGGMEGRMLN
jgi:NAD(P)-dependent dehydrogenase (short-subunit alcohol dehydrogenase family)